jgi:hypothetical protein
MLSLFGRTHEVLPRFESASKLVERGYTMPDGIRRKGQTFLFGFAAVISFNGMHEAGEAVEESGTGDKHLHYVSVVAEDGFSFCR